MIAVIQRVNHSSVKIDDRIVGSIDHGLTILLGIFRDDSIYDIDTLVNKIINLRIFSDNEGKMNLSIRDISGAALVISQFTLAGNIKKGRRPSFSAAMSPPEAEKLYELFCEKMGNFITIEKGVFGTDMEVEIINDGPVTFVLDSREL